MKKIFQFFAILFVAASSLTSCTSDSTNATSPVLLKKLQANVMGADELYLFSYNGTKLNKVSYQISMGSVTNGYSKFIYSGNQISVVKDYENNVNTYNTYFMYNAEGQLIEVSKVQSGVDHVEKTFFTYNADNTVDSEDYTGTADSQGYLTYTEKFYFENNKLIRKDYSYGSGGSQINYTYDTANHPLKNVTGIDAITLYVNSFEGSKSIALGLKGMSNNIIKEVWNPGTPASEEVNFESTYNDENYPVSLYTTPDSPGPYNYQYEYNQ
ncbi:MAG TPA: hypothetical protein PKN96_10010 [Flavobacterium sp.]|uniref:hypothetical protein n=1 Tax=Flavobacterium sp. TaxID=239 RepID=UPI002BDBD776|nr:hypothetical protein [Flavobacterium sp.]HNP33615.1 hypothetical protein [Flavobacterium sp.]